VRLYFDDPYCRTFDAAVVDSADGWCTLTRSAFYPGGGGQPADRGVLVVAGDRRLEVGAVREDEHGALWHSVGCALAAGDAVRGELDWPFRFALMRGHALLHVVNTLARDRFGAVITGAQIGADRSRIDLRLGDFDRARLPAFEDEVNAVIARDLPVVGKIVSEDEFRARPELIRTRDVMPPVVDGTVRIVEIVGFDAQACGGTHVHSTAEIGRARLVKLDNKGKDNKRLYWELVSPPAPR
jgi:misacylated tRNA(Ala) deacylase